MPAGSSSSCSANPRRPSQSGHIGRAPLKSENSLRKASAPTGFGTRGQLHNFSHTHECASGHESHIGRSDCRTGRAGRGSSSPRRRTVDPTLCMTHTPMDTCL
eukprot:3026744-Prymnesium_polylepis.1